MKSTLRDAASTIGGAPLGEDLRRIEAVLRLLGPGQQLAVDANGRFDQPSRIGFEADLYRAMRALAE